MIKKLGIACFILVAFSFGVTTFTTDSKLIISDKVKDADSSLNVSLSLAYTDVYDSLHLSTLKLSKNAFDFAIKGFHKLTAAGKIQNTDIITIVDFSQASTNKRMYIIDLKNKQLLQHSLVSHGRNTGALMATSFSNIPESNQSSLGFYVTSEIYQGKHGLSLRLDGMEKNINDKARERAIVIHGADYATEGFCKSTGYLGRSFGCPAVPSKVSAKIINTIKNGSCLFIFSPDKNYIKKSSFLS